MYQKYYRKYIIKSIIIIVFLITISTISTYLIYNKFKDAREHDVDTGKMEAIFHGKEGNKINITKFNPVSDAVGLSTSAYEFTIKNGTDADVKYKIILEQNTKEEDGEDCISSIIPNELLKLSFRIDHQTPVAKILSEYQNNILYEDIIPANSEEDYSIRLWTTNSNFIIDKNSHYHATIKVIEER